MRAGVPPDQHAAAHPPAVNILPTRQKDGTRLPSSGVALPAHAALGLHEFIAKDSRFDSGDGQETCLPRITARAGRREYPRGTNQGCGVRTDRATTAPRFPELEKKLTT